MLFSASAIHLARILFGFREQIKLECEHALLGCLTRSLSIELPRFSCFFQNVSNLWAESRASRE